MEKIMSDQVQQKFEQWFESEYNYKPVFDSTKESDSARFEVLHTHAAFTAWQGQQKNVDHWKANHQNMVDRARFLIERTDLPVERIEAWQEMGRLQAEVDRLRGAIKAEAEYCQGFADQYKGEDRGKRHQERADRLMGYLEEKE